MVLSLMDERSCVNATTRIRCLGDDTGDASSAPHVLRRKGAMLFWAKSSDESASGDPQHLWQISVGWRGSADKIKANR